MPHCPRWSLLANNDDDADETTAFITAPSPAAAAAPLDTTSAAPSKDDFDKHRKQSEKINRILFYRFKFGIDIVSLDMMWDSRTDGQPGGIGTNGLETVITLRLDQGGNFFLIWLVEHEEALQHVSIQQELMDGVVDLDRQKRHVHLDATEEIVFSVMILSNTYTCYGVKL